MNLLDELGLTGSYQVHQAPVILQPDIRAHQVFIGFEVLPQFPGIYQPDQPCFVVRDDQRQTAALKDLAQPSGAIVVIPAQDSEHPGGFYGLVWVVDRLLGPGGCPWDQAQTHQTLKKHLIEESYELLEAIDLDDEDKMVEELGDVLLQPVMHTQIKKAAGSWDINEPAKAITDKLIRRHPHVFGDVDAADADEVLQNWDRIKKQERGDSDQSILDGVPKGMPALMRALEVSRRAARAGFEWPDLESVWDKVEEERSEVKEAIRSGNQEAIESEIGDLIFSIVQIARWSKADPEQVLHQMLNRFADRFRLMEKQSDRPLEDLTLDEWDQLWNRAKTQTD